jgi:hypothetical protein
MQAAKPLDGFRDRGFDVRFFADVAVHEMSLAAGIFAARAGRLGGRLAARYVNLGDNDLGALLDKTFGGGAADAAAAAGDERNFARQARHGRQDMGQWGGHASVAAILRLRHVRPRHDGIGQRNSGVALKYLACSISA